MYFKNRFAFELMEIKISKNDQLDFASQFLKFCKKEPTVKNNLLGYLIYLNENYKAYRKFRKYMTFHDFMNGGYGF